MATQEKDWGQTWQAWLAEQRAASTMEVKPVRLVDLNDWGVQDSGHRHGRADGKFFSLIGVEIRTAGREVGAWGQPLLQEVGEGAIVLLFDLVRGVLVSAKPEPGNAAPGCVLLAPTIQASKSNLEQAHGGKRPPRAELLDGNSISWTPFQQDGGRFYRKVNHYAVISVNHRTVGDLNYNERWLYWTELKAAVVAGECNSHLLQVLALARALGHF